MKVLKMQNGCSAPAVWKSMKYNPSLLWKITFLKVSRSHMMRNTSIAIVQRKLMPMSG